MGIGKPITNSVVGGNSCVVSVTLSPYSGGAMTAAKVMADTQVVSDATRSKDTGGVISTVTVVDKDDQGAAFDIWLLDANVVMGTENSDPSISDANAANIMAKIPIGTGDYTDLGGCKVAYLSNLAIPIQAASGSNDFYVATVNGAGTPTYTSAGVVLRFGILQD